MTAVSFDRAVQYYDSTRGYPDGVPAQIRDAIVRHTQADSATRFLEAGIGTGLIGVPFLESSYRFTGVDISAAMMAQIQEKLPEQESPPLVQADMTRSLPFADGSFGVVTAIRVFHVLDRWQAAIAESRRILRPGGSLLIARDASVEAPGTLNPVIAVHGKWDEILEGLGIAPGDIRPGLWLSDEPIVAHLQSEGASTEIADLASYKSDPLSLRQMAARHQQRMYSRDWELPDDVHAAASKMLDAWLNNECEAPDREVTRQMVFRAIIARWQK